MTLNRDNDGPFAFAAAAALDQIDATEFLIDAVVENAEFNGASITDWESTDDIVSVYVIVDHNPETFQPVETERDIGPRGAAILENLIATGDEESSRKMLRAWTCELYGT